MTRPSPTPAAPPRNAIANEVTRNWKRMSRRRAPTARRTPISRVCSSTDASIMNIMLASVLEQTREIGVRRAVGARRRDIRFQFLVTSFAIAFLGGAAGVGLGLVIARVVAAYASWPTVVTAWSIALALAVSVGVGLASGMVPAMRAA